MSPGNCSGSYSEPPRARAIACRSSSCPREVDATTFSIRNLAMGTPPGPAHKPARLEVRGTQRRCFILFRLPGDPSGDLNGPRPKGERTLNRGILLDPLRLDAL